MTAAVVMMKSHARNVTTTIRAYKKFYT